MNNTELRVKKYIIDNELLNAGDTVVIGLSGGADSVCLFLILDKLSKDLGISLEAVHVNHGIRGLAADEDESFVIDLCKNHSVPITTRKVDIPHLASKNHETEEECGRRIRYQLFNEKATSEKHKIAVAHHMEDQAETVIFRMARGTGIKGIAGMKAIEGKIIRPLLCLHKSEIISYLKECEQEYRNDATNEDTLYSRNLIRKEITPLLERINEGAVEHIVSLSVEANKINDYIEKQAVKLLSQARCNQSKYDAIIISKAEEIIRTAAIRKIIQEAKLPLKDVTREHIDTIDSHLAVTESSQVCLPNNHKIIIEAGKIYVDEVKEFNESDFLIKITNEGEYKLWDGRTLFIRFIDEYSESDIPQSPYTKWLDYDKISNDLCIRKRQIGDYFIVSAKGDKKSIKKYMIDEKIPRSERDTIPILANGHRATWVVGKRISWDVKVTKDTKRVVEISVR